MEFFSAREANASLAGDHGRRNARWRADKMMTIMLDDDHNII